MSRLVALLALAGLFSTGVSRPPSHSCSDQIKVRWLEDTPEYYSGTTFGLPWPQGKYRFEDTTFAITNGPHQQLPLQSWTTGYWRDGSIKWTAHAIPKFDQIQDEYTVLASSAKCQKRSATPQGRSHTPSISVADNHNEVTVNTGKITISFPKKGGNLVSEIKTSSGKIVGRNGALVLHSQSAVAENPSDRRNTSIDYFNFESNIEQVSVSKNSKSRALVTVQGKHRAIAGGNHTDWLQFVVRFYLYADSEAVRIMHTIVFDGKAENDFISGLGIRFQVPLANEQLYDRHVRIAGVDGGFLHEAVQGLTGLSRNPGANVTTAQVEGKKTPDVSTWSTGVSSGLQYIPVWNGWKLSQSSPDGFTLKKRTKPGQGWINIPGGNRSDGLAYLGGATVGGLAIGLRDFWKKSPNSLEITNAASDQGEITIWMYDPDAPPLDLRPYHDDMGEDTYEKQLAGLAVTYEDYEPGFNTPYGIARTNEIYLYPFDATPPSDDLALLLTHLHKPPVLAAEPAHIRDTKALGSYWALSDTSSQKSATLESHLDFLLNYYEGQREYRKWYGFLDYGDFMHTYDADRHTWRYDVGGYAWDNSELSPDLFYWQYYLRTGRADIYRFAEALTRHTGEVDVYHIGDWKGLGTRHGVQHYGDSAKQVRISQPQYRKYFYFLSGGDERVGDLLTEVLDTDKTYGILDPQRKVRTDGWKPAPGEPTAINLIDWSGLAAGWLIEWERRGPRWQEAKSKLTGTATGFANLKNGFVTGSGLYVIGNGTLGPPPADPDNKGLVAISHLDSVFGLPEVVSEMLEYWGDDAPKGLKQAWFDYCYYYGATPAEQKARYGQAFSDISLFTGHSRLTAYYANQTSNATVAQRAWKEFYNNTDGHDGLPPNAPWKTEIVNGSIVLAPIEEATWIQSSNAVAQYGLAVIQDLAYVRSALDSSPYPK
ncbi:hypothetical protein F5884DRAFT_763246 [Xylogone sp. PMI_703]|nr:hypothetical protein F5884DRAFT_763246 [Xylogone sp. PMI_703]